MMRSLAIAFGVVLLAGATLLSGVIHGRMSGRWGPPPAMLQASKELDRFPERFGTWQLTSNERMSDNVVRILECAGYFVRTYADEKTGAGVHVAVTLGPAGPIATHTPEICYSSRDYAITREREKVVVRDAEGQEHAFWATRFEGNNLEGDVLWVFYGWSTGSRWEAPSEPRLEFAGSPHLYKLQLSTHAASSSDEGVAEAGRRFLQDFVSAARPVLVEASKD